MRFRVAMTEVIPSPEWCADRMELCMAQPVAAPTPELAQCSASGRRAGPADPLTALGRKRCFTASLALAMAAVPAMAILPSMRQAISTAQPGAEEQTAPRITTVAW